MADTHSTPRRKPGRPAGVPKHGDPRERLLDIALDLFARHGVAETTLSAIARKAGMTPAMAHYYFKTREQLFDVLLDERIDPVRTQIEGVLRADTADPVAALTELARRLIDLNARHRWFGAMWIREVISDDDVFKQHMRRRMGNQGRVSLAATIGQWQLRGLIHPDLEPGLLVLSILGLVTLSMAAARRRPDDPVSGRIGTDAVARHIAALLRSGVAPPGRR